MKYRELAAYTELAYSYLDHSLYFLERRRRGKNIIEFPNTFKNAKEKLLIELLGILHNVSEIATLECMVNCSFIIVEGNLFNVMLC